MSPAKTPFDEFVVPGVRYRSRVGDVVSAVGVVALGALFAASGIAARADADLPLGRAWMPWVIIALCVPALLVKRRFPVAAVALAGTLMIVDVGWVTGSVSVAATVTVFDTVFAAFLLAPRRRLRAVVAVLGVAWAGLVALALTGPAAMVLANVLTFSTVLALPALWGASAGQRDTLIAVERERAQAVRRAAEAERRAAVRAAKDSTAAELHDEIAARLSAISLQAGALDARSDLPSGVSDAAAAIKDSSHEALAELRGILTVLAEDGAAPGARVTAGVVETICTTAEAFGVGVEVAGTPGAVAPETASALARISREAIVNAAHHAPGAPVSVVFERDPEALSLDIANPLDPLGGGTPGSGLGLDLMAERWVRIGGTGSAGPEDDGRWHVRVSAPTERGQR